MVAAVPLGVRCLRLSLISLAAVLLLIWGKEGQRNIELLVFGATSWTLRLNWLRRMSARGGGCDFPAPDEVRWNFHRMLRKRREFIASISSYRKGVVALRGGQGSVHFKS